MLKINCELSLNSSISFVFDIRDENLLDVAKLLIEHAKILRSSCLQIRRVGCPETCPIKYLAEITPQALLADVAKIGPKKNLPKWIGLIIDKQV